MREILFRGKLTDRFKSLKIFRPNLINDDFVYGSLVIDCDNRTYICVSTVGCRDTTYINNGITTMFEVIPETVGEYTGLKDKNGKRIFEGDVLSAHFDKSYPDDETLLLVGNNGYAFTLKEEDSDPEMIDNSDMRFFDETFVVIGNVHDNPELLKGE